MLVPSLLAIGLFAATANAHGGVTSYVIGGTTYQGWQPYNSAAGQISIQRPWPSYDPIMTASASTIRCNGGTSAELTATIAAGSTITAKWAQWTHAEGPVTVYMARCPSTCKGWAGDGAVWFKIDEAGLMSGTVNKGEWGNGVVLKTLQWTSTIPAALAAGEYLIRHELLALHQANTPQFYPECAQLTVTGGGGLSPDKSYLVSLPGAFSQSDPGVNINIYSSTATTYQIPGPPKWTGGNGAAPTTVPAPPASTTVNSPPVSTAPTPGAALYGQCGGANWSGPTTCAQGTCTKSNDYYSQCLP